MKRIIRFVQKELKNRKEYHGPIDGLMGPKTRKAFTRYTALSPSWSDKENLIGFIQQWAKDECIEVGKIDGKWGPMTEYAYGELKSLIKDGHEIRLWQDIVPLSVNPYDWPDEKQSELISHYGQPGTNLVYLEFPYPHKLAWGEGARVSRTQCHKKVKDSYERILKKVLAHYGIDQIRKLHLDKFGGCYNKRKIRGGSRWSTHAWGIAADYDPGRNKLKWNMEKASFAHPNYDYWWKCWEEEGWYSLGRQKNYDWMHVQAARR